MDVDLKILNGRVLDFGLPELATSGSAAVDLRFIGEAPLCIHPQAPPVLLGMGFAIHIRKRGICAMILPRSGIGHNKGLVLGNGTGLIDSDFQGEILVSLWNRSVAGYKKSFCVIHPGYRIAQMVFVRIKQPVFNIVESFEESERGAGGFGSSGR